MTARRTLPARRRNNTFPVQTAAMSKPVTVTVGYFDDDTPAEVFVSDVKVGSGVDAVLRDAAVTLSIGMQYGVPLSVLQGAVTRNPDASASSVLGQLIDILVAEQPRKPPPSEPEPAPVPPPTKPQGDGSGVAERVQQERSALLF